MYIFFKVVTVKPPIVSQDKKIKDTGDSLVTKKKIGTHLLPLFTKDIFTNNRRHTKHTLLYITQNIPFYQGHLYKFPPWTATYFVKYR